MDPVSIVGAASAVTSLLQFSGAILSKGYNYASKVLRAPEELRQLLTEVAALNSLLDQLQSLLDVNHHGLQNAVSTLERIGTLTESRDILDAVSTSIGKCSQIEGQTTRNLGRRMLWPFQERETKDLLQRFQKVRDQFNLALSIDSAATLRRIEPSVQQIQSDTAHLKAEIEANNFEAERTRMISWLNYELVDVQDDLENALIRRQKGTNLWFLDSEIFRQWFSEANGFVCVYGIPGAGKTVLSSTIIEKLRSVVSASTGLIYFFCNHRDPKKQNFRNFIGNGLIQLLNQAPQCMEDLKGFYTRETSGRGGKPSTKSCVQLLKAFTLRFDTVFIVLDALDECNRSEEFIEGLDELRSTSFKASAKVLITSRQEIGIERQIRNYLTGVISMTDYVKGDIRNFIEQQVTERVTLGKLKVRDINLLYRVIDSLSETANGMFLWASIQIDKICGLRTDREIKESLGKLPIGLDDTYTRILSQIKAERADAIQDIRQIFEWLVGSLCPITLGEISEALAIRPGDLALDQDGIANDVEDIPLLCGSLVKLDATNNITKATRVTLTHLSIAEFLQSDRTKAGPVAEFYMDKTDVHGKLAKKCIQYLSFSDFESPAKATQLETRVDRYRLLMYAARYWMSHLKQSEMASEEFQKECMPILYWFICPSPVKQQFSSWTQVFPCEMPSGQRGRVWLEQAEPQPSIFYALLYDVGILLNGPFSNKLEPRQRFWDGMTPLHVIAYAGHHSSIQTLLERGADVHARTDRQRLTALHIAAEKGHAEVVRLLLAHGADPHAKSSSGSTPFYRAPRGRSMAVMQLLWEHKSNVNAPTWDLWTPLHEAVFVGDIEIVEQLLLWGADLEACTLGGASPINFTEQCMEPEIGELLMRKRMAKSFQSLSIEASDQEME